MHTRLNSYRNEQSTVRGQITNRLTRLRDGTRGLPDFRFAKIKSGKEYGRLRVNSVLGACP